MSDGGNGKKPIDSIDLKDLKRKLLEGKGEKILDLSYPLKIRQIGRERPVDKEITQEMRVKAANALGEILGEHAATVIPLKWSVYQISMLHTLVSIGMKNADAQNNEFLVNVAGQFREAVSDMWLRLGMTNEDCWVLNQDVIIMTPRAPDQKKT